jgi:hypothetical protein
LWQAAVNLDGALFLAWANTPDAAVVRLMGALSKDSAVWTAFSACLDGVASLSRRMVHIR